ncbi:MAG TPA: hypothetical protein DHW02_06520 [Ktedonobacter sp.]|nr:hypothetical protein [Ktedonobacter sp.]
MPVLHRKGGSMAKAKKITGLDAQATTAKNARMIASTRLEEFEQWGHYADEPQRVSELHNLRIAAKRLRYTLEIFADVLPSSVSNSIEEVTKIQEELGTIHDTDVMMALVRRCLEPVESHGDSSSRRTEIPKRHAARFEAGNEVEKQAMNEDVEISHSLLASLVDVRGTLTDGERCGLEELMNTLRDSRDTYYGEFQRHWHQLQEQNFSRMLSQQLAM